MGKVVDFFSKKEIQQEELVPTPEQEIMRLTREAMNCMKYHKVMYQYAEKLIAAMNVIGSSYEGEQSEQVKWVRMTEILESFENLIDVSQPDHQATIHSIFEGEKDIIHDGVLREIVKQNM